MYKMPKHLQKCNFFQSFCGFLAYFLGVPACLKRAGGRAIHFGSALCCPEGQTQGSAPTLLSLTQNKNKAFCQISRLEAPIYAKINAYSALRADTIVADHDILIAAKGREPAGFERVAHLLRNEGMP